MYLVLDVKYLNFDLLQFSPELRGEAAVGVCSGLLYQTAPPASKGEWRGEWEGGRGGEGRGGEGRGGEGRGGEGRGVSE